MNLTDYVNKNTVIHCETLQESKELMKLADRMGFRWTNGTRYTRENNWELYEENTCYNIYHGLYGNLKYYESIGFNIIKFKHIKKYKLYISKYTIQHEFKIIRTKSSSSL